MSDTILIIERLENCFDMSFNTKESEKLITPNDITDYIWLTLGKPENNKKCVSQILFYNIRKELCELLNISKNQIGPSTCLKELGSKTELKSIWNKLETRLELSIPQINKWLIGKWSNIYLHEPIGQFTSKVIEQNAQTIFELHGLSKNDIYGMVKSIVIDVSGVSKIKGNSRIVDVLSE